MQSENKSYDPNNIISGIKKEKILIVDDETETRKLLGKILDRHSYHHMAGATVSEAKKLLTSHIFDLVLCDILMPGESGLSLIRHVRTEYPGTAILVISAMYDSEKTKEILELGVHGYLTKPFRPYQVLISVANSLKIRKLELESKTYQMELESKVKSKTESLEKTIQRLEKTQKTKDKLVKLLKDQLYFLQNLIDAIPNPVFYKDQDGKFTGCNTAFENYIGLTKMNIIGRSVYDLFPEDLAESYYRSDMRLMRDKQKQIHESSVKYADGSLRDVIITKACHMDSQGEPAGIVGTFLDITERKKIEEKLLQTNTEMDSLISSIISILIGISESNSIIRWNKEAEKIFGIQAYDVLGKSFSDCGISMERDRVNDGIAKCLKTGKTVFLDDILFKNAQGKDGFLGIKISRFGGDKTKFSGVLLMGSDITEKRLLQQQLLQTQKLESIGQLTSGIAHEINTPTQYVGHNIRFLKECFPDFISIIEHHNRLRQTIKKLSPDNKVIESIENQIHKMDLEYLKQEIPQAIDQTLEGVEQINKIVQSMKLFSHPGSDQKKAEDINKLLDITKTMAKHEWKYVAEFETDFNTKIPPVPCIAGELNQAFLNIIINAAHAVAESIKGEKNKRGKIKISTLSKNGYVEIRISDTGIGIPHDIEDRIFDPFFTTKEPSRGTGQGLSIAHTLIVKNHKGSLRFESQESIGTTFIIRLPIEDNGS